MSPLVIAAIAAAVLLLMPRGATANYQPSDGGNADDGDIAGPDVHVLSSGEKWACRAGSIVGSGAAVVIATPIITLAGVLGLGFGAIYPTQIAMVLGASGGAVIALALQRGRPLTFAEAVQAGTLQFQDVAALAESVGVPVPDFVLHGIGALEHGDIGGATQVGIDEAKKEISQKITDFFSQFGWQQ
jgi:hypothetical protein